MNDLPKTPPTARDILLFLHKRYGWDIAARPPQDEPDPEVVAGLDEFLTAAALAIEAGKGGA